MFPINLGTRFLILSFLVSAPAPALPDQARYPGPCVEEYFTHGDRKNGLRTTNTYGYDGKAHTIVKTSVEGGVTEPTRKYIYFKNTDSGGFTKVAVARDSIDHSRSLILGVWVFDAGGNLLSESHDNNRDGIFETETVWTYDARGNRLSEEVHYDGKRHPGLSRRWTYDPAGRMVSQSQASWTTAFTYTLDSEGKILARAVHNENDGLVNARTTYTYDSAGRKLTEQTDWASPDVAFDASGKRIREGLDGQIDEQKRWTYDSAGNILSYEHRIGERNIYLTEYDYGCWESYEGRWVPSAEVGHFVQADVVNLRLKPAPQAPVVARIRINTEVVLHNRRNFWVEVSLKYRPPASPVRGWIKLQFLDTNRHTWQEALVLSRLVGQPQEKQLWAERAVAIDGTQAETWNQLEAVLAKTGKKRALESLRARRAGQGDVYFAVSSPARTVLLARLRFGNGEWELLGPSASESVKVRAMEASKGLAWYGPKSAVQGSPFVRPFLSPYWNANVRSGYLPATCTEICSEKTIAVLGPVLGQPVLATTPIVPVQTEPMPLSMVNKRLARISRRYPDSPLLSLSGALVPQTAWQQMTFTMPATNHNNEIVDATSWILFGENGEELGALGSVSAKPATLEPDAGSFAVVGWYRLMVQGVPQHLVVHKYDSHNTSGYILTLISTDGKLKTTKAIIVAGRGC